MRQCLIGLIDCLGLILSHSVDGPEVDWSGKITMSMSLMSSIHVGMAPLMAPLEQFFQNWFS